MARKTSKNNSKTIKDGTTMQTKDNYLLSGKKYSKPGSEKKGNYRRVVVVDSNRKDDLAVVKLTTAKPGKTKQLDSYKAGKSAYKPYVETKDNQGQPIKQGSKFIKNPPQHNVSKADIKQIKKDCFKVSQQAENNRQRVRKMKGRK